MYLHISFLSINSVKQRLGSHPLYGKQALRILDILIIFINVSCQTKVSYLHNIIIPYQNVSCSQVAMNALKKKVQPKVRFRNNSNTVEPPSGRNKSAKTRSIMNGHLREGEHNSLLQGLRSWRVARYFFVLTFPSVVPTV